MDKDFDRWNIQKKNTHRGNKTVVFYEREIWWSKVGVNIGVEIDGKHELFLRPVIIIRKFNKDMALVVPTTTRIKTNKYYLDVSGAREKIYKACLSQIRTISSKRLLRKIDMINENDYRLLIEELSLLIRGLL
jgi:mRNA interferase MazF